MKKFENLVKNKKNQIIIFIFMDLIFLLFSSLLALELRFDFSVIPSRYMHALWNSYMIDCIFMLIIFLLLKIYTSVWRYASVTELLNVIDGCVLLEFSSFIYHYCSFIIDDYFSWWFKIFLSNYKNNFYKI